MYELKLENFSGPIEKLLELIEAKKMEITDLSLAEVTADFLDYLKKIDSSNTLTINPEQGRMIEMLEPKMLADFVAVAAALLLIKSKAILPDLKLSEDEEKDIKDLEERLRRYAEFKPAMLLLKKLYEQKRFSVSRQLFLNFQPVFYPAPNINTESLKNAVNAIFTELNKLNLESQIIESSLIKLEEKIEEIAKKIESGIGNFSEIIKEKSRAEIIVLFLALLHLLREQLIKVEQKKEFSDIIIMQN
jgi:segregation and condensation protein A